MNTLEKYEMIKNVITNKTYSVKTIQKKTNIKRRTVYHLIKRFGSNEFKNVDPLENGSLKKKSRSWKLKA